MKRFIRHEPFDIYCFEESKWPYPIHKHNFYELIFIQKGDGLHHINDNYYKYVSGDVFLLGPEDFHSFEINTSTQFFYIRFTESYFNEDTFKKQPGWQRTIEFLLHSPYQSSGSILIDLEEKKILNHLLEVLALEYTNKKEGLYEVMIDSLMKSIFTVLARNKIKYSVSEGKAIKIKKPIEELLIYISQNIYQPENLRLEHLAKRCHYSPQYLSIFFKKNTGESLQQYILKYKIKLIVDRLKYSDLSISQIAYEFGFTDESHLLKIFKKYQGTTPTNYRKINSSE